MYNEEQILNMMNKLKLSREEAIELLEYDDDVSSGKETVYDLTPEQKANVQDMMRKTEHRKSGPHSKHNRKPNELKEGLIIALTDFLENVCEFDLNGKLIYCEDVNITNKNRMIHFKANNKEFDLQLIEKRIKNNKGE